ncbi:TOMM precursor leader peptide-binding protein [Microbacterium sp.]|uniref:TOMM precursor leader peptide-binding protein n=1 Tax=Microbacterium sp. TaxID=51671 RepID=UPI00260AF5A8|nr:TOMM precursor leader peptide-binding protein [Microbacterium sp.]
MTLEDTAARPTETISDAALYRLRTGLHILPHGDDEVFVRDGSRSAFSKIVRDSGRRRLLSRVVQSATEPISAPLLAERWNEDDDALSDIVAQLADSGVLVAADTSVTGVSVLLLGTGVLADTLVTLAEGDDRIDITRYADLPALQQALDADDTDASDREQIIVVAGDALDPPLSLDTNALALEYRIPAVYAHVDGPEAVVGPLVIPGETACYLCHDLQDEGARHLRDEYIIYKDHLSRGASGPGADPAVAALAAAWVRLALAKHDRDERGFLDQRIVRVETSRMEVMTHRVLTIPRCPACATSRAELEHTFL